MMLTIRKTDKRFTGSDKFKYVVDIRTNSPGLVNSRIVKLNKFHEIRDWCITTWGMSCEREHWLTIDAIDNSNLNTHWCWHTEFYDAKIYLASDKEVTWFKLKWL